MKVNGFIVALVVGMLASVSAHAFGTFNNATYASRFRPVAPTVNQAKPEIQVAVMANSPLKRGAGATSLHPFGPPRPYAAHSH
jgi:hypothetical protein